MPTKRSIEEFLKNSDAVRKILVRTVEKHQRSTGLWYSESPLSWKFYKQDQKGFSWAREGRLKNVKKLLIRIKLTD